MKTPTCKYCGKEGHYKYQCFQRLKEEKKQLYIKPIKAPQRVKIKKTTKTSSSSVSARKKAINKLDGIISKIVRIRSANKQGYVPCFTCGRIYHWKMLDCGHFFKRTHLWTRFNLDNCRPQCKPCNQTLGGNYAVFNRKIRIELGDRFSELENLSKRTDKMTTVEIEQLIIEHSKILENIITAKFENNIDIL